MKFIKSLILFILCFVSLNLSKLDKNFQKREREFHAANIVVDTQKAFQLYGADAAKSWGDTTCHGKMQSPIKIQEPMTYAENLEIDFDKITTALLPGRPVEVKNGVFRLDANLGYVVTRDPILFHTENVDIPLKYNCYSLAFHSPAEHNLYGRRPDVEMQMECELEGEYHVSPNYRNRGLIISYFFEGTRTYEGEANKWGLLQGFNIDSFSNVNHDIFRKMVKIDKFVMYEGSRTHPPCTENNLHVIDHKVYKVPQRVINEIKETLRQVVKINGNARPIQPLNGRSLIRNFPKPEKINFKLKPQEFK